MLRSQPPPARLRPFVRRLGEETAEFFDPDIMTGKDLNVLDLTCEEKSLDNENISFSAVAHACTRAAAEEVLLFHNHFQRSHVFSASNFETNLESSFPLNGPHTHTHPQRESSTFLRLCVACLLGTERQKYPGNVMWRDEEVRLEDSRTPSGSGGLLTVPVTDRPRLAAHQKNMCSPPQVPPQEGRDDRLLGRYPSIQTLKCP